MLQLGGGKPKTSKNFEIKLDNPFVVFHGDAYEAEPVELTGTIRLTNTDHMNVRSIKIRFEGKWRVSWYVEPGVSSMQIREKGTVINEEVTLYPAEGVSSSNVTHKIAPGEHEWRFKFLLDPLLPESVEGLSGSFVVYDLRAEIDRGYMSKALFAEKHVRVIRTLGRDVSETVPMPYSNEDTWRDKLWYHIFIPTRYHIFGTSITVEFILCPLMKGVTIGKIKMEILERVQLRTDGGRFKDHSQDLVVASHEQRMPENTLPARTEETTGIMDQSHHFKVTLPLPKSLNRMRQSVDTEHVKIFHNLKVYVNLHNPDGHISQLLVRNLLHIFISPNLPVGDDQTIQANESQLAQVSQDNESGQLEAPPTYERHQLDQLYDEIDPQGFLSGSTTPYNAMSRRGSHDEVNGALLDPATANNTWQNSRTPITVDSSTPSAAQLQNRLAALQFDDHQHEEDFSHPSPRPSPRLAARSPRGVSFRHSYHHPTAHSQTNGHPSAAHAHFPSQTNGPGSHASFHGLSTYNHSHAGTFTPAHQHSASTSGVGVGGGAANSYFPFLTDDGTYDMDMLARIPSYATAVRTPVPTPPPSHFELPTYEVAVSQPGSPHPSPRQSPRLAVREPVPVAPARAHVRDARRGSTAAEDALDAPPFPDSGCERRGSLAGETGGRRDTSWNLLDPGAPSQRRGSEGGAGPGSKRLAMGQPRRGSSAQLAVRPDVDRPRKSLERR